jgi:hypothetical protein
MESVICNSHDIILSSIKNENMSCFKLMFDVKNDSYNLYNAIGFKLFNLLGELNKDTIYETYIDNYNEASSTIKTGIIFKQIGKELGITQKYIFSNIEKQRISEDTFKFILNKIDKPEDFIAPKKSESVLQSKSTLDIKLYTPHHASFVYLFSIDFDEDMPLHMNNIPGMLMKKIFYRLKTFLDNIK